MGVRRRFQRGQMTVELAVCIPAFLAIALVVCNAMLFFGHCAAFDRLACDAVRVWAASPAQGQSQQAGAALVQAELNAAFPQEYIDVSVFVSGGGMGFSSYTAILHFRPTLFGRPFSGRVFGTALGSIDHETNITIDVYKPGVVL